MDDRHFDALTRFVATSRTRRQVAKALGGGTLAALAGAFGSGRAGAVDCASGVVCGGTCCDDASDVCLRDRCTSCPSGVICRDRCCAAGQQCLDGRCTGCASGITCGDACCDAGETCVDGRCRTTHEQPPPTVQPGPNPPPPCPPGYRECDGVCYPGGCCVDAECGDPCLVCDTTSHICQGCSAGQICQPGRGCCAPVVCPAGTCGEIPDGCGGRLDCGDCPAGQTCQNGACVPICMPDCTGKSCGDDGCGGSCGSCDASQCQTCGADHTCETCPYPQICHKGACCAPVTACPPGVSCGTIPDGCGGIVDCGDCDLDSVCVRPPAGGAYCCYRMPCQEDECGVVSDGCGGTRDCGGCLPGLTCHQGYCCTPNCAGKPCGSDDGCGGSCDTCAAGQTCCGGACVDLSTDVNHCGDCATICDGDPNDPFQDGRVYACQNRRCVVTGCHPGFTVCGPEMGCCTCNDDGQGWTCSR